MGFSGTPMRACLLALAGTLLTAQITPAPLKVELRPGAFALKQGLRLVAGDAEADAAARFLQLALRQRMGVNLPVVKEGGGIVLRKTTGSASPEAYTLAVAPTGVSLEATGGAGLFYAAQSLLQLIGEGGRIPAQWVEDAPRFPWRGFMLDESRHFMGEAAVKRLLDEMAALKLNRFHWHLTDQDGWRIEIKAYPKLTEVGAQGNYSNPKAPRAFYTQAQIRALVAYAQARHIQVIPEIDLPGHATAATRAYPELSGGGTGEWSGFTFHPAKETTYRFLDQVFREVAALFPGPWLHLGGDEVHFGNQSWTTDPEILAFGKAQGLATPLAIEHHMLRRVEGLLQGLGRNAAGWDEVTEAGLDPARSLVFWWRHDKPELLDRALAKGHPVVLCPRRPCYFDFVQHESHQIGRRWDGFNEVLQLWRFPDGLLTRKAAPQAQVLGLQGCLWTERVADPVRMEFMAYPRLAALAEAAWTAPARKKEAAFLKRLRGLILQWERRGLKPFDPFRPERTPEPWGPDKRGVLADG